MIINFVLVLGVLLGCCTIALDIGLLELKQLQIQNAADAAALGVIFEFERGNTDYGPAAVAEAAQNGFTDGTNNIKVTTHVPPISGIYTGNLAAAQAQITQTVSSVFGVGSYKIGASATALLPPCVYMMSTNPKVTTLTITNNTTVNIGCAAYAGWNGYTDAGTRASFNALYVGGPYSASSFNGTVLAGSKGYFPTFNAPPQPDPLSYLASPVFLQCDTNHQSKTTITATTPVKTLNPGTYCGGLDINGSGSFFTTVTFTPGLYILTGSSSWSNATIQSSGGVMFYLTQSSGSPLPAQLTIGAASPATTTVNLSASTTGGGGTLPSVLIFGDRAWPVPPSATQAVSFTNTTLNMDGIVYLTNTGMSFTNGTLNSNNFFGLVVDNFVLSGSNFTIKGNYSGVAGGNPYRPGVGLSE